MSDSESEITANETADAQVAEQAEPRARTGEDASGRIADAAGTMLTRFSESGIAMVLTDPKQDDNPIIYVNAAFEKLTGYARSAAIGRNCRFLQGPDTDAETVAALGRAVEAGEDASVDLLNYRADGSPFHNRLMISPMQDADGDIALFIGLQLETGEGDGARTGLDAHLREIQHRVKNHLSMIVGMIRMQSRRDSGPEGMSALARRVESLQLLYEELSAAGGRDDDDIPLGSYLSRVASSISHLDGRAGIRVKIEIDEIFSGLHTATQLGLILSEVLTNASQHAFEGRDTGVIEVRASARSGGGMQLCVSDDGIGIPEGETWPVPGTLGGQIVDGLIRSLDGTINVTCGATGTTVTIEVPRLTRNPD